MKDFQQTDTDAPLGTDVGCSGATIASVPIAKLASDGGSAGTTETLPRHAQGVTGLAFAMVEIDPGEDVPAGDHITRWDITTANLNITLQAVHVCYWDDSLSSFSSLGSTTGIGDDLDAAVKTVTITGASAGPTYAAGDRLFYVFVGDTAADHGNEQFGWTPSQLMTTPIAAATDGEVTEGASVRIALQGESPDVASLRIALQGEVVEDASLRLALQGEVA